MGRDGLITVAWCVAASLAVAPLVHGVAIGISGTLGGLWPFSLVHCRSAATPGCGAPAPVRQAWHVR